MDNYAEKILADKDELNTRAKILRTAKQEFLDKEFAGTNVRAIAEKAGVTTGALYNALHGTNLQLSCPVENIRLDNTLYMNIINDVSCLVDNKIIVLAEHPRSRMYIRVHS